MMPVAGETSLATIQSQPCGRAWRGHVPPHARSRRQSRPRGAGAACWWRAMLARMSGFSTRSRSGFPVPVFLSFARPHCDAPVGHGSGEDRGHPPAPMRLPTAVEQSRGAFHMHHADPARVGISHGPDTSTTSAPAAAAAAAMAWPACPRSGWRRYSAPGRWAHGWGRRYQDAPAAQQGRLCGKARLDGGEDFHGLGHAPFAEFAALRHGAGIGADKGDAVLAQRAALRRVAAWDHMRGFMAGAISTGLSVASSAVEARSSAKPMAAFAIKSAVAGATTRRSASRERRIWPISCSAVRSNRSPNTRSPESAPTDSGVTNCLAASVRITRTVAPRSFRRRIRSQALIGGDAPADDEQNALLVKHGPLPRRWRVWIAGIHGEGMRGGFGSREDFSPSQPSPASGRGSLSRLWIGLSPSSPRPTAE